MGIFPPDILDKVLEKKFGGLQKQFQDMGTWDDFKRSVSDSLQKQIDDLESDISDLQSQVVSLSGSIASTTAAAAIPTSTIAAVGSAFASKSSIKDLSKKLKVVTDKLQFLDIEPPAPIETISSTIDTIMAAIDAFPFP